MKEDNAKLHPLVQRQLKRAKISIDDIAPNWREKWVEFLLFVSRAYSDYEQDLYLLERSMDISSRELLELNDKLESAQQIAHLGYWNYNKENDLLYWSKNMYQLTGFDPLAAAPTLSELKEQIHEDDRSQLIKLLEQALSNGKKFSLEYQFKNRQNDQYVWHYLIGQSVQQNTSATLPTPVHSLAGIVIDITERKQREFELEKTHQQLLSLSRQAGMAEIATSILHNIGNILNSANVSIDILKENLSQPFYIKLFKIVEMLKEHREELDFYLTQDEKGKLIPPYLIELVDIISKEYQQNTVEIRNLNNHLTYIKETVAMQKTISGTSGLVEKVYLPDTAETALQMVNDAIKKSTIKITKKFDKVPLIDSDKTKIIQILLNLIRNAKDAVVNNPIDKSKEIEIIIKNKLNEIQILVIDNGMGITPENSKLIFSFGFTTKKEGHGFGLHGSALLAKEIGGTLQAKSPGANCGATFILSLPIKH